MMEAADTASALAWRVLVILEAGTLAIAAAAALVRWPSRYPAHRTNSVLMSNTSTPLGQELKRQLESHGCGVHLATSDMTNEDAGAHYDALVIVGAETKAGGLDGLSELVSKDVFNNLKLLESLSKHVKPGGRLLWAGSSVADCGAFSGAEAAFDEVLKAQLELVAKSRGCAAVWAGRGADHARIVASVRDALLPHISNGDITDRVRRYVWKCLNLIS